MFRGCTVAVVVPAFNEADKIAATVQAMPALVDHVLIVDDGSHDGTAASARAVADARVEVVVHRRNQGVGAAISSGYARALELGNDVVAVMAGDGQMDPADLPRLLTPVVQGEADYAKGNRLAWPGAWREMPLIRLVGTVALAWLTRAVTGYHRLSDSQCGYTAISRSALHAIGPDRMYPRYGYPNDLLLRLADIGARVIDVPVRPVYGPAWRSGLRPSRVIIPLTGILVRGAARRVVRSKKFGRLSRGNSGSPR